MGVDHHVYIGPYLRVRTTVKQISVDRCADHNFPDDAGFCPKCGKSKRDRIQLIEKVDVPDYWEENYQKDGKKTEFNDYLYSTSMMSPPDIKEKDGKRTRTYLYLPNRYYKELGLPHIEGGKYDEEEIPFDGLDIPGISDKFVELYKDEINYLIQWFEVEVSFGYISYCS